MRKRLLSTLLMLCMVLSLLPIAVSAADNPATSSNVNSQNYARAGTAINSYLYENESGGLTRVEYVPVTFSAWSQEKTSNSYIIVENYNNNFELQHSQSLPIELDIWGGFFAGETYNFLIFGQENPEANNSKEVIRIVKYSKEWQRLGQDSLYGANTTIPFRSGILRAAEYGDELYIRASHQMYSGHQANLTIAVRQSDMKVTDSAYEVAFYGSNYVSHSFNQFILIDHKQRIVALDHGDAYPRSAVLAIFPAKAGAENITRGSATEITIQNFPGATGDNYTGASLGGLAETAGGYVVAYNYDGVGSSTTAADRSVYFAYVDKNSRSVVTKVISSAGTMTPVLVPTSLNGGYILWNASDSKGRGTDTLYYAAYSDGGSVGTIRQATASLSDCQPILHNGKVVWYTTYNSVPTFYLLDENGVTAVTAKEATSHPNEHPTTAPSTSPTQPSSFHATLSSQKLAVNGEDINCEKYNIDGSNYFKLRDLAYLLNGTGSQFEVGYDSLTSTVSIATGEAYTSAGGELSTGMDNSSTAKPSSQAILIDGVKHDELTVYNIGGSNFFQLRELGNILGFEVGYDQDTNTAIVRSMQK